MKGIIAITIVLMTQLTFAGDASFYESLGFSYDGKYYAYTQDGIYDGLGAYWVELGIIDVKSNKYVGRAKLGGEDNDGNITEPHQAKTMLKQLKKKLSFKKYGFSKKATEEVLISRPHTDLSIYTNSVFSVDYWAQGGASAPVQSYELLLNEIPAPLNSHNEWCEDWYGNSMMELRLKTVDPYGNNSSSIKDLQVDKQQPSVRACSFDYSIAYVFHHNDSVSTVLKFRTPGFEGPNERYMVITGTL